MDNSQWSLGKTLLWKDRSYSPVSFFVLQMEKLRAVDVQSRQNKWPLTLMGAFCALTFGLLDASACGLHWLAVWPWGDYLTTLILRFLHSIKGWIANSLGLMWRLNKLIQVYCLEQWLGFSSSSKMVTIPIIIVVVIFTNISISASNEHSIVHS